MVRKKIRRVRAAERAPFPSRSPPWVGGGDTPWSAPMARAMGKHCRNRVRTGTGITEAPPRAVSWFPDAGAPVPSVFLGGVPGRMGRHRTRGGAPLAGASRAYFGSVLEVAYGEDFLDVLVHEILHGFIEVSVVVVDVWLAVAVFVGFGVEHDFKIGVFHGFVDFLDAHVRHVGFAVGAVAGEHPRVRPP